MPTKRLENPAKRRSVQTPNFSFRRDRCRLVGWNPGLLKDWQYRVHDVLFERSKGGFRHYVFADTRHTRLQERVLQLFNRECELSGARFEVIVLDLRIQIRIHDGAI